MKKFNQILLAVFIVLLGVSAAQAQTCGGLAATIVGTAMDDDIEGTAGADVIVGLAGNDRIKGLDGDDIICGNEGDDDLLGDAGDDRIFGDAGNDVLEGGAGADECDGISGIDSASDDCELRADSKLNCKASSLPARSTYPSQDQVPSVLREGHRVLREGRNYNRHG